MKRWSKISTWGLVVLMTANIAMVAYYFFLQAQIRHAQPTSTLTLNGKFPAFSGVDIRGAAWQPRDAPCRVLRIANDDCPYCRKDKQSYATILDAARHASCEIVEMAPVAGTMTYDPRPGVVQLKFADADVGSVLFPFATPQTVILDRDWSVKMTRRGMFDDQSLAASLAILQKFAAR